MASDMAITSSSWSRASNSSESLSRNLSSSMLRGRSLAPISNKSSSTVIKSEYVVLGILIALGAACVLGGFTPIGWVFAIATVAVLVHFVPVGVATTKAVDEVSKKSKRPNSQFKQTSQANFSSKKASPKQKTAEGSSQPKWKSVKPQKITIKLETEQAQALSDTYQKKHSGWTLKEIKLEPSSGDMGGHGGNLKGNATATSDTGETKTAYFFLKPMPKDPGKQVEFKNNHYINEFCPDLSKYIAGGYSDLITINDTSYFVMDDATEGGKKEILGDFKLAGQVSGINPICSLNEVKGTDREKGLFNFMQMWLGVKTAPDYLAHVGGPAVLRIFGYHRSKAHLEEALNGASVKQLHKLNADLACMHDALMRSKIALIGGSVILLKDKDGNFEVKLIDFAHIHVDPVDGPAAPVYKGNRDRQGFIKRQKSNAIAMRAFRRDISNLARRS